MEISGSQLLPMIVDISPKGSVAGTVVLTLLVSWMLTCVVVVMPMVTMMVVNDDDDDVSGAFADCDDQKLILDSERMEGQL